MLPSMNDSRARVRAARSALPALLLATLMSASINSPAQNAQPDPVPVVQTTAPAHETTTPAPVALVAPPRTVSLIKAKTEDWPEQIEAHGNIMPWQETHVGVEVGGLRLLSVRVNVGDIVKKGQILAQLNPAPVEAELDAANAQLMEAQAAQAQAAATLERAKRLAPSGGVSQQELTLYETQKRTAEARINAARAQVKTQQLRLDFATLVAPDDGVISARSAAEGAIVQSGSELFRLIRKGRLEWRAEVKGELLLKLAVGQEVTVKSPVGSDVKGRIRQLSPTIDLATRNGLVYVDLPEDTKLKAGLYASGSLLMGKKKTLVLPSTAILAENGASRVFKIGAETRVESISVQTGRTKDGWVEIVSGLTANDEVVFRDVDLLKAGDLVKVQESEAIQKVAKGHAEIAQPAN